MNFSKLAKHTENFITDNSPTILTALGVTGALTTAFFTGKASFKARDIIDNEQYRLDLCPERHILEPKEKAKLVWKVYIPAVGTAVITVVCIVSANRIGTRRAAALASALTISEKAIGEYKDKVLEKLGSAKEQKIRDEIAQDRANQNPVGSNEIVIIGTGESLCYDEYSSRYFKSDMETLKKGQNDINYTVLNEGSASLGDFYKKIGLSSTEYSEEVGWTTDELLELRFTTIISDDQRPCISISFKSKPIRNYYRIH
jgi:hypothetical protein